MTAPNFRLALEDLARHRREVESAIVTLARVAGVDATPYLVDEAAIAEALSPRPPAPNGGPPKEAKPRPQRPASRATNGTGRAHKVSTKSEGHKDKILAALKGGSKSPSELAKQLGFNDVTALRYHTRQLETDGLVKSTGGPMNRQLALA